MNLNSSPENNSVKYEDQFLYIAKYLENNPEDFRLARARVLIRFNAQKYFREYMELVVHIPKEIGYFNLKTTTSERVLGLLLLHAILSSGNSLV